MENIKENNLENVVAVNAAVGSKSETKILYKSEENLGDHKLFQIPLGSAVSPYEERETIKVDLMKIDTQEWEPEIINGAKKIIKRDKSVMFLEYSPASYLQTKLNGKEMEEFCKAEYKKIWWIDECLYIYKI